MRQRNNTGYTLVVASIDDGSGRGPFELSPGEVIDWPGLIPGCDAVDYVIPPPDDETPPAKTAGKKTTAKTADGGDPA